MKTIDYYLNLPYKLEVVEDSEEGGYVASYPELPGCLTCADNIEDLIKNAQDAKKEWIKAALENEIEIQEPSSDNYSGQFKLRIPKTLHKTLAERAKVEGISMNQYCIYLLSKNMAINSNR